MERHAAKRVDVRDAEQVRQADHVVEVGMGEEDVEFRPGQVFARPIGRRSRVEHHATFGQQQTGRLPSIAGMITGGAQQNQFHDGGEEGDPATP